ncbi:FAD-binding oxidoreductase [Sphingomonas cannabina]|uniref:NAD(P)/FAD-dependent oxidoreductase n=1 Tax=Sphingomonas cannabina TaxID=2899123 RepID=UPI001F1C5A2B|nr:FAD-binding oxidoreductase [Sphingomonas cannabina]UIJ44543.1 FAD-binding oxidoreductase [Sphingomonas cannabina]
MSRFDFAIVGAGIAGATLAAELAPHGSVVVLEEEEVAGYHATGRSAAFWSETYGGPAVQPLTTASREALDPYLAPLGSLHIGRAEEAAAIDALLVEFEGSGVELRPVDPAAYVPGLRSEWALGVIEPSCAYIDVAGLHADALARARQAGAVIRLNAGLRAAERQGVDWRIETADGPVAAGILIDAAGAWADPVAERCGARPLGIRPYRRTMAQLRTDPAASMTLPLVVHIGGSFYFKPETGGRLWLSPHDEIPTDPCDAQPEEIDVAVAVDRFERVVDWRVAAVERKWAGLRSFAPDRRPVYGFAPDRPGFFWCAGQGGFGIQTAPAAARLAAALLLGTAPELDPAPYAPDRFAR